MSFIHEHVPGTGTTLLLLHGTGGSERDLLSLGRTLLPGAALLSPRGKVVENGLPRFFRRFAEGVFDIVDLKEQTEALATFVKQARAEYSLPGGIYAVGYSNGANIATSLLFLHPGLLAGAVLFRGMVPYVPDPALSLAGTDVLLASGRQDRIAQPEDADELASLFERAGAGVTRHWHEGGHEVGQDDIDAAQRWLRAQRRPG